MYLVWNALTEKKPKPQNHTWKKELPHQSKRIGQASHLLAGPFKGFHLRGLCPRSGERTTACYILFSRDFSPRFPDGGSDKKHIGWFLEITSLEGWCWFFNAFRLTGCPYYTVIRIPTYRLIYFSLNTQWVWQTGIFNLWTLQSFPRMRTISYTF